MKILKSAVTIVFLSISLQSQAYEVQQMDLIRSADLYRITNLSMHYESAQYSVYSQWRIAADELVSKTLARDQARAEFQRMKKLFDKDVVSEDAYMQAELALEVRSGGAKLARGESDTKLFGSEAVPAPHVSGGEPK